MTQAALPLTNWPLLAYGGMRMPLALLELPLFVLLPNLYSDTLGIDLGVVGAVLFAARLIDAFLDPVIGAMIDRQPSRHYRHWIWMSLPLIAIGFLALMNPPRSGNYLVLWLGMMSMLTYVGYSVSSIAYQAWGSRIGINDAQRARVTGVREACGLAGVLLAAAWLTPQGVSTLSLLFILLAVVAAILLLFAPLGNVPRPGNGDSPMSGKSWRNTSSEILGNLKAVTLNQQFRWLVSALLINGIATAIPATLLLFFVADILGEQSRAPVFLLAYFFAGALGMPIWVGLSQRIGLRKTWMAGIGLAIIAFVWTLTLGAGDGNSFLVICLLTGFALGADLAMPPAILASVIAAKGDAGQIEGSYFGVWNFVIKLNLAAAAGLALPVLALSGYQPGMTGSPDLIIVYAAIPCVMKLLCGLILWFAPFSNNTQLEPC